MTARLKPLNLGPFVPGVDNRRPDFKMRGTQQDGGDFLRSAVNVDISDAGTLKRRPGYARVLTGTDCHSFWADGADAFMVQGQNLVRITGLPDNAATAVLRSGFVPGRHVAFDRGPDGIYYSNGLLIGRITDAGDNPVSPPPLSLIPLAAGSTGGSMDVGRYGLCFTYLDAYGRESGSTVPFYTALDQSNRTLSIVGMPTTWPAGVAALVVYMTEPDNQMLQRAATLRAPVSSLSFVVQPALGARCPTVLLQPMPPGDVLRVHYGRLLTTKGRVLMYSEPFAYGLHNPTRDYIVFPADITVIEVTSSGVWVCADQTYWLAGTDVAAAALDTKLPYGAVLGSSGQIGNTNDVFWMSPRGIVKASQDGVAKNIQEEHVAVAPAAFAAGFFREIDGHRQIAESQFAPGVNRMAAASYMDAEVIRKGVSL